MKHVRNIFAEYSILQFKISVQINTTSLTEYYKLINDAELHIVHNNIDSAIIIYQKAWSINKRL